MIGVMADDIIVTPTGVALGAQLHAIPFYERLGYVASGEVYLDAGIEHRWMDVSFGS